jgi:hypothetical protein
MFTKVLEVAGVVKRVVVAKSPEILLGTGVVLGVTSTVLACRATLKIESILDIHKENMDKIKSAQENEALKEQYSDKDVLTDKVIQYKNTVLDIAVLYGPSIVLGVASYACFFQGYRIMNRRNIALLGAYKGLEKLYNQYRKNVIDKYGESVDEEMRFGRKKETIIEVDEEGNEKIKDVSTNNNLSSHHVIFDESNRNWSKEQGYNEMFVQRLENYANDKMRARDSDSTNGYMFLNEVYEMLGFEPTEEGQFLGWMVGDKIKFHRDPDFIDRLERSTWIDFDVKLIYDKLSRAKYKIEEASN